MATLILIVYAFSITPKIFLHNLIADHNDNREITISNTVEYSAIGFNCKCENVVAESPFIPGEAIIYFTSKLYFSHYAKPAITLFSIDKFFSELRGPPGV